MSREHSSCLLCAHTGLRPLAAEYAHAYLVACENCGFVFCKRIPSPEELANHYAQYPRNLQISPITIRRYEELLDKLEPFRKNNRLLDIGCGDGHFLATAKKRGWEVYGTEFTSEAVEVCTAKGIRMGKGILNETMFGCDFDVITSFEVIEHIHNPAEEISTIRKMLRTGGAFYFTTPNFNSYSRRKLGGKWHAIEYPEHLSYYTHQTVSVFLNKNGFRKKKLISTGINLQRLRHQGSQEASGKAGEENLRQSIEEKFYLRLLKNFVNFLLTLSRRGDTLKGLFVKN